MRYFLVLIVTLCFNIVAAQSQQPFTQRLQQHVAGQGTITLIQDDEISRLVDNMPKEKPAVPPEKDSHAASHGTATSKPGHAVTKKQSVATTDSHYSGTRFRHKERGFRIQVYAGTGNATAKKTAKQMEAKVRKALPELAVYCHFKSPRWICRVGDFATREEAQRYLAKIRKLNISPEASIVPDEVFVVD